MIKTEDFEQVEIASQAQLRSWLSNNYAKEESIWLVTYKKSVKGKYVSREEFLDELLCFGWIDGIRRKLDEDRTMQLISQRKVQHWAKSYKERAARLIEEGKMHRAGFDSIDKGKESGLWNFMDDVDNLIIPPDLERALKKQQEAFKFFDNINESSKRNALRWLKLAKSDKTRLRRINELVSLSLSGEKLPGS